MTWFLLWNTQTQKNNVLKNVNQRDLVPFNFISMDKETNYGTQNCFTQNIILIVY